MKILVFRTCILRISALEIVKITIFLQKRSSGVYLPPMYPYIIKKMFRKSTSRFLRGWLVKKFEKKWIWRRGVETKKKRSFLGGLKFKSAPTCWWVQKSQKIHFRVRTDSMRKKFCWKRCINFQLDPRSGKCSKVDFSEGLGFLHRVKYIGIEKVPCKEWRFSIKWGFPKKKTSQLEDHFSRNRQRRFF